MDQYVNNPNSVPAMQKFFQVCASLPLSCFNERSKRAPPFFQSFHTLSSRSFTHTLAHTLTHSLTHTHSLTLTLTHSHTHTHTFTHSHPSPAFFTHSCFAQAKSKDLLCMRMPSDKAKYRLAMAATTATIGAVVAGVFMLATGTGKVRRS